MKQLTFKTIALAVLIALSVNLNCQNTGPSAPEAMSFEPVDAANMVNLNTGDFVYSVPIINIPGPGGGYPLALSYHGGIALDQEASWVGLGWNLNPGAINRGVIGVPDDFKDASANTLIYTYGGSYTQRSTGVGIIIDGVSVGASLTWNSNWSAWTFSPYVGVAGLNVGLVVGTEWGITAGVGTPGSNFSVGVGIGTWGSSVSIGMGPASISANFNGSETSFGLSVGTSLGSKNSSGQTVNGTSASIGISLSSDGNISGGLSVGASSFSNNQGYNMSGENIYTVHSSWQVPLIFFNLSYDNVRWWYFDNDISTINGLLYLSNTYHQNGNTDVWRYDPAQDKNYISDVVVMPYSRDELHRQAYSESYANLMLPGTDNFQVSAQGLNGNMSLQYFEPALLVGQTKVLDDFGTMDKNYNNINREVYYSTSAGSCNSTNCPDDDARLKQMLDINPYFYFENSPTGRINISPLTFENFDASNKDPFDGFYKLNATSGIYRTATENVYNGRKVDGNFVQYFTNREIIENIELARSKGFIETNSIVNTNGRNNGDFFEMDGIGAFAITTNDGVTYHYSLPVYQFEEYFSNESSSNTDFYIRLQSNYYAYTWLLTAITGPDFIDKNQIGLIDNNDDGYWVKFDYGKWTDAYVWKTPWVNAETEQFGRKQIYYLNTIETKTHEALFIKEIRNDGFGKDLEKHGYSYTSPSSRCRTTKIKGLDETTPPYYYDYSSITTNIEISAKKVFPLRLDKIVLLKKGESSFNIASKSNWSVNDKSEFQNNKIYNDMWYSFYPPLGSPVDCGDGGFRCPETEIGQYNESPSVPIATYYDQNVIDINDYNAWTGKPEISKEIRFNYDNTDALCKNAPNSPEGKLTLKSVEFKGQNGYSMMPPYTFDYYRHDVDYDKADADKWGFHKDFADNWSLKSITTPIGSKIDVLYGSDSDNEEAVFGEIRDEKFDFKFSNASFLGYVNQNLVFLCTLPDNKTYDDYFGLGESYKYWLSGTFNVKFNSLDIPCPDDEPEQNAPFIIKLISSLFNNDNTTDCGYSFLDDNFTHDYVLTKVERASNTNQCKVSLKYTTEYEFGISSATVSELKMGGVDVRPAENGGGVRVEEIKLSDGYNSYSTFYNYNRPGSNVTSGVTSFAPGHKGEFIPLPTEVPAPCVYYKYVTVSNDESSTMYEFETPAFSANNEDPQFNMGSQLKVTNVQNSIDETTPWQTINASAPHIKKAYARSAIIDNKTSRIGRLNSVKTYNPAGDALSKQNYVYNDNSQVSVSSETYYYMKTLVDWASGHGSSENSFFFVSTSKKTTPSILEAVHTTAGGITNSTFYSDFDINTGAALMTTTVLHNQDIESITSPSDITNKIVETTVETLPAYLIGDYKGTTGSNASLSGMGSKVYNIYNKNMLTQTAATISKKNDQVVGASIETWKGDWNNYLQFNTNGSDNEFSYDGTNNGIDNTNKVWRKHKTYVWGGELDADGTYSSDFNNFANINFLKTNWNTYFGDSPASSKWQKSSEVTLYDHYSTPIEVTDINGDFAATKKDANNVYTIASAANSSHTSFAATSFEERVPLKNGSTTVAYHFGAQIISATSGSNIFDKTFVKPHTGYYSLGITSGNTGCLYLAKGGNLLKGQKYRASVWVHYTTKDKALVKVKFDNVEQSISQTTAGDFGDWTQINLDFDLPLTASSFEVYVMASGGLCYIDDFRVSPFSAAVSAYTYDNAGNVTAILNNDNFATKYDYDAAGRLTMTYIETKEGFKPTTGYQYNYNEQFNVDPKDLLIEAAGQNKVIINVMAKNPSWGYSFTPAAGWIKDIIKNNDKLVFNVSKAECGSNNFTTLTFRSAGGDIIDVPIKQNSRESTSVLVLEPLENSVYKVGYDVTINFSICNAYKKIKFDLWGYNAKDDSDGAFIKNLFAPYSYAPVSGEFSFNLNWKVEECMKGVKTNGVCLEGPWSCYSCYSYYKIRATFEENEDIYGESGFFQIKP